METKSELPSDVASDLPSRETHALIKGSTKC